MATLESLRRSSGRNWMRAILLTAALLFLSFTTLSALPAQAARHASQSNCSECIDTSSLKNAYDYAIGATRLWNEKPYLQGQGVTVAVVDSGIAREKDFKGADGRSRILANVSFVGEQGASDHYGHGTHVAGLVGGNGASSGGAYVGVAPQVNLVNVKVSDSKGMGSTKDVVAGLQWVYEHRKQYNIRVVNLSLDSSESESYHLSPLDAALEILWFNRIVVVVSAGNSGSRGIRYPPANDPFVVTVGAMDDRGTASTNDDVLASFSPYGKTQDHMAKPDLVAPGTNLISVFPDNGATLAREHPDHVVTEHYFRMSGTSMSAAVTAGAAALLLQAQPNLTPDQVKYRLMNLAEPYRSKSLKTGYLNIYDAVHSTTTQPANLGLLPSHLLQTGSSPATWTSVNWDSVNWDSVNWDSVNWDSVNWDSVNWDSNYWGP